MAMREEFRTVVVTPVLDEAATFEVTDRVADAVRQRLIEARGHRLHLPVVAGLTFSCHSVRADGRGVSFLVVATDPADGGVVGPGTRIAFEGARDADGRVLVPGWPRGSEGTMRRAVALVERFFAEIGEPVAGNMVSCPAPLCTGRAEVGEGPMGVRRSACTDGHAFTWW
jgi:hypothetical protein